jgi:3-hydroxyacyl-CoA dehydrogenase/enoyl-CoA hydratase/3-hydroxybutyryl-CoA epimerase
VSNQLGSIRRSDRERIAVLELDQPDRQLNVVDEALLSELRQHVADILADPDVDAYVLTSAKPGSFGAGADVSWLPELAAREDAEEFLRGVHELMLQIVRAPKPMVTALNGSAFGGALELALASRRIVAVESAQLGLPEVTLGLLPGGGGTQLLNRFVDPATAAELLTSGRRLSASEARDLGLLHEVVADEALLEAALRAARAEVGQPAPEPAYGAGAAQAINDRREALRNSREGLSRAAAGILDVLEVGARDGVEAGLRAEREVFLQLLASPEARAAIHLFLVRSDVNRRSRGDGTTIAQVAVVGGGQMGSGIAATAVTRGLRAVVRDVDDAALARSRGYLEKVLARRGGVSEDAMARWQGTTEWDGFAESDVVIEAVFELPDLKTDVLRKVSELVSEDTLLATNTSAIPIRKLATAVSHPERFLGMHFFSPVERMPLVELIAHQETAPRTLQRAAAVGRQLGKVPVVVGDAPGFFTSRVYARWLMEGIRLLLDGAALADIDAGAKAVGFPVGPLQAHDEATLQLVLDASVTQVAEPVFRDRLDVGAVRQVLETLVANGVQGRRHGVGFYRYDENGKRVGPNEEVTALISSTTGAAIDRETIGERLLLAFATECFLCWDEGILCHPDDGDIASVLGIGFPRVLGGPFHWADEIGAAEVRARCERLGDAFPPGRTLTRLAAEGGTFSAQPRRSVPFEELPA